MKIALQKRQMWEKQKKFDEEMKWKRFEEKIFDVVDLWLSKVRVDCDIEERNVDVLNSSYLKN